jgi:hypothetical protein
VVVFIRVFHVKVLAAIEWQLLHCRAA